MKVDIVVLVALLASLSGVVLGWLGHSKTSKKEIETNAAEKATMVSDISHIKTQIDKVVGEREKIEAIQTTVSLVKQTVARHDKDIEKLQEKVAALTVS